MNCKSMPEEEEDLTRTIWTGHGAMTCIDVSLLPSLVLP